MVKLEELQLHVLEQVPQMGSRHEKRLAAAGRAVWHLGGHGSAYE